MVKFTMKDVDAKIEQIRLQGQQVGQRPNVIESLLARANTKRPLNEVQPKV